jgi:hypothetical protein
MRCTLALRCWCAIAGAVLWCVAAPAAVGAPITYVFSGPATGTLGATSFTGAQTTVTGTADTANITLVGANPCIDLTSVSINIAGIGSMTPTGPNLAFSNPGTQIWGFENGTCAASQNDWLDVADAQAATYGLVTAIGPSTGSTSVRGSVATTLGSLMFTTAPTTFQATLPPVVVSCPANGGGGDLIERGFYVTGYGADNLGTVTLQYSAGIAGIYTVALTANAGAYNGPVLGTQTASAAVATSGDTPMTFTFGAAVAPGSTIAFTQTLVSGPGSLFFDTGTGPCAGVTETNGTTPPLDTPRRDSVALVITSGTGSPDLNQHGLTGSWFEPATSGQGFEVEVYPDLSPGAGFTQVSWFTFDTAAGGADHQRWYTLSGPVASGQPNAVLTIYQNTGGNFNAPPITNAQAVGSATLSFATCTSGELSYNFTDGTGRVGNIPLTRLLQNVTCSDTGPFATNADFAFSGNWYDPATTGQGFSVEVNPVSAYLFAAWYTYAPAGAAAGAAGQRWYTAQAPFTPGQRLIPVTIFETTGGIFDMPTSPGEQTLAVGTGTLAFESCTAATFSYNFTGGSSSGLSGIITLSRVGPVPPGCTVAVMQPIMMKTHERTQH